VSAENRTVSKPQIAVDAICPRPCGKMKAEANSHRPMRMLKIRVVIGVLQVLP
jgi:hypothetical protein